MEKRVISRESKSMVYHRPECRYVRKIYKRNRVQLNWDDAEYRGYHPCKCCDGISYLYNLERVNIERFSNDKDLDVDLYNNKIYIRTDVGCWKIVYRRGIQKFILLHRNYVNGRIRLDEADSVPYHRQGDVPYAGSIIRYLEYIQKHDAFKQSIPKDLRQMPQDTRQQKLYYRAAKKREEKRRARRLENIFLMIERKEGIRELSFC